jgi:DNA polymerase
MLGKGMANVKSTPLAPLFPIFAGRTTWKCRIRHFVAVRSGLVWHCKLRCRTGAFSACGIRKPKSQQINKLTPEPAPSVSQLLAFYLEAGVDCALSDEPIDRLSEPEAPAAVKASTPSDVSPARPARSPSATFAAPTAEPVPAPEAAIAGAREAARSAASLEILRDMLEKFDGCALKSTATRLVFADGNPKGRIMFVGEAPGRDEDIEGLPFVGRSGKLLDRMIAAIGLDRTKVYIANVIPWRPPGNRTPTPQETQICLPFIQRQIELVDPDILVTLGNPSTQTLLSTREGIMKTRGRWFNYETGTRTIRAMATFHPAYLLRSPSYKRLSWQDLRAIAKALPQPAS